jgi:hypothetical protein
MEGSEPGIILGIILTFSYCTVPSLYLSEIQIGLHEEAENTAAVMKGICKNCYAMRNFSNMLNLSFLCFPRSLFPQGISAQIYA